ncbi:MAG: DMT family transporter [Hyphomicrobiaceae bacterium]
MLRAERTAGEAIADTDRTVKGVVFLITGLAIYSLQDIIIKQLSDLYSVHQIVFVRSIISIPLLFIIIGLDPSPPKLKTSRPVLHAVRGLCQFIAYTSFYLALAAMRLADAVAIAFSAPLVITVLSVIFLGEKVGIKRWGAIVIGIAGVVVIVRPGTGVFEPAALFAVTCAVSYGASAVLARPLGRGDGGAQMALYATIVYLVMSGGLWFVLGDGRHLGENTHPSMAFLLRAWSAPTVLHMGMMLATGLISAIGLYCLAQAYRVAEASAVSPFEYTGLIWAISFGFLIFGEVPDIFSVLGILLIVGSGMLVIHREKKRDRPIVTRRGRLRFRSGL